MKTEYLKLAQRYHPDAVLANAKQGTEDGEEIDEDAIVAEAEEKFIEMKEAFDRLVELND